VLERYPGTRFKLDPTNSWSDELIAEQALPYEHEAIYRATSRWPGARVCYEAGPTGFGLARHLRERGVECEVVAPSLVPSKPGDRVKTDRRDARRLAYMHGAGLLTPVVVPTPAQEAVRDLVRAREDVRGDLMAARHRVGKLLLRHDLRFEGNNWTQRHLDWLGRIELPEPVAQSVLLDGIGAIDALLARRESLETQMASLVEGSPWERQVAHLRCLRGIDTLSALGLCAEIGDFERFARPAQLMSYLGLVPSENTTGEKRRQGSITKSGSRHARRLLVEAAWHYRRAPRKGTALRHRQEGQPQSVCAISWKAQQRLHRSWVRLDSERGKRRTLCAVAVARELAGFCWAVTTAD